MKKFIFSAFVAFTVLYGCQKNDIAAPDAFYTHIERLCSTKTFVEEENDIVWSSGDQLVAFMKTSLGLKYKVKEDYVGEDCGYFLKADSGYSGESGVGVALAHNVVYYPYLASVECSKSGSDYALNVILPSEQAYAHGSFGADSFPMVAVSEDEEMNFYNVCGGIRLQLTGYQKISSIKIEGKKTEKLSGPATITAYADPDMRPFVAMAATASTSVTLNCGSKGVQLDETTPREFIISLPPMTFEKGFTVTVTDVDGKTDMIDIDTAQTIIRSSILTIPAVLVECAGDSDIKDGMPVTCKVNVPDSGSNLVLFCDIYKTNRAYDIDFGDGDYFQGRQTVEVVDGVATVSIGVEKGGQYTVLFWAQNADVDIFDVTDLTDVQLTQSAISGHQNIVAYAGREFVSEGLSETEVELTLEPVFAQFVIAYSPENLMNEGLDVSRVSSSVKISGMSRSYNVAISAVGETCSLEYEKVPASMEPFVYQGQSYVDCFTRQVGFVEPGGTGIVSVSYAITTPRRIFETNLENVPVKAGYSTCCVVGREYAVTIFLFATEQTK